jgi:zinc protease
MTASALLVFSCFACGLCLQAAVADDFPNEPPVAPLQAGIKLPMPAAATLENGMDVVVISNDEIPWVSVSWRLLAGAKFDPDGKPGVASLTAGMLRQGTKNYTSDEFAEKTDFNAVSIGGGAGHEVTWATAGSLKDKVDLAVELLAEAVRRPVFPEKDFKRVKSQSVQGMMVSEKDGGYVAGRAFDEWLYGDHFMARPASGSSATVSSIGRTDLVSFHKNHYMPNHSTLIFSGDISTDAAVRLAKKHFSDWAKGTMPPSPNDRVAPDEDTRVVVVDRTDTKQVQIRMGHTGFTRDHPDYVASQIFNQVFGGSFVSRLNKRIRVEEGFTYGARGGFSAGKEPGRLTVSTFTRPEKAGETIKALIEEVEGIRDIPPSSEELTDAKSYIIGSFSLSMETPQDVADKAWNLKFHGLPYTWYDSYFNEVQALSRSQIQEFAKKHVRPDKLKIVVVGQSDEVRSQLEDVAPVTVIKPGGQVPPPEKEILPPA